jgi:hypothetical protein
MTVVADWPERNILNDSTMFGSAVFIGVRERWGMLGSLGRLVEQRSKLERCQSPLLAIRHALTSAFSAAIYRRSTLLVPSRRSIREEMILSEPATLRAIGNALSRGQPVFVMKGTLERVSQFFGIDRAHNIRIMLSSSGLLVCFGTVGGRAVVVYAAGSPLYNISIARQLIGFGIGRKSVGALAPAVLLKDDGRMMVEHLPGSPIRASALSEVELQRVILVGMEPLTRMSRKGRIAEREGDQQLIAAILEFVAKHPHAHRIEGASERLIAWDRTRVAVVPVHGDYWVNNLLLSGDEVTGIVDWDRARELGCSGFDALNLGFVSYSGWSGVYISDLLSDIWRQPEQWHYPFLQRYCQIVREAFSLTQEDIEGLAMLLWLSTLWFKRADTSQEWIDAMYKPIFRVSNN